MNRIELIRTLVHRLEPIPLDHGYLEQRRRRVGIVLEHHRGRFPIVREIESAIDRRRLFLPRAFDERNRVLGNLQLIVPSFVDHVLHGLETPFVKLIRRALDALDFIGGELVIRVFTPVRSVARMPFEAACLDGFLPVGARRARDAFHVLSSLPMRDQRQYRRIHRARRTALKAPRSLVRTSWEKASAFARRRQRMSYTD
jgi:hypothetical protein